jgi:hypothetical protein
MHMRGSCVHIDTTHELLLLRATHAQPFFPCASEPFLVLCFPAILYPLLSFFITMHSTLLNYLQYLSFAAENRHLQRVSRDVPYT